MIFALTGYGLLSTGDSGVRGTVALTPAGEGMANAEVRVDPRAGADDAHWLAAIAWQGGGLVVDRLERTAPGVYRTTEPLPVTGEWKTMIRLHTGNALSALPIYLPADPAIPVKGIPAEAQIERPFGPEQQAAPARAQDGRRGLAVGRRLRRRAGDRARLPGAARLGRAPRLGARRSRRAGALP